MAERTIQVTVEIPKGSRNKYELDHETGRFKLDRMLFSSVHYPSDYGFIEETWGEDGDPLDAMVLVGESTFTGCLIEAKPVGLFLMFDEKGPDQKVLSVPISDPQWNWVNRLDQLPSRLLDEIEHFFMVYKDLEMKKTKTRGFQGVAEAWVCIEEARVRFQERLRQGEHGA